MAGTMWTVPNAITLLRIALIVPFVLLIAQNHLVAALVLFLLAGLSDLIDGYIARRWGQQSSLGRMLDPAADKLLTTAAFISLALPRGDLPAIPVWLAAVVVMRDIIIVLGALAIYMMTRFSGFKPSLMGKVNTGLEVMLILCFLAAHSTGMLIAALPAVYLVVLVSIVCSGADYILVGIRIIRGAAPTSA